MPAIDHYTQKSTFTSLPLTIPKTGPVQFFVNGSLGGGQVVFTLKGADGVFHEYPELSFLTPAAREFNLVAGDEVIIEFRNCVSAGAELRQQ